MFFFCQAEDGIRDSQESRGLGDVYKRQIYRGVLSILDTLRLKDKVRLLGVRLSNITHEPDQISLFGETERRKHLLNAVDSINDRYGEFSLVWASYLQTIEPPAVISPAWRPSGVKNIHIR